MEVEFLHATISPTRLFPILPQEDTALGKALSCFSESRGLDRSLEIAADLNNLEASSPSISSGASSYVTYLKGLAEASINTTAVPESHTACLKLMTHAYCAHLQHLTNGSKIGAEYAGKRNLFQKKAVNMYRRYPHEVIGKDPLVALQRNVNEAGSSLSPEEKAVMKAEVVNALAHSVQLFEVLAQED